MQCLHAKPSKSACTPSARCAGSIKLRKGRIGFQRADMMPLRLVASSALPAWLATTQPRAGLSIRPASVMQNFAQWMRSPNADAFSDVAKVRKLFPHPRHTISKYRHGHRNPTLKPKHVTAG